MTERIKLPWRRRSEVVEFEIDGIGYRAQASRFPSGAIAEVFLDAGKCGSGVQIAARDGAIAASLALQMGMTAEGLLHAATKLNSGAPAGPIGRALAIFRGAVP